MKERIHIIKKWPCGGGMEAIVRLHLDAGEPVVAISGEPDDHPGLTNLCLTPNTFLRSARRRLKDVLSRWPTGQYLFYNGYGIDWLDWRETGGNPILYLHSDYPELATWGARLLSFASGTLCVNTEISRKLELLATGAEVRTLPLPVKPPSGVSPEAQKDGNPVVIGYSGRVEISQKRLDRLPTFIEALEQTGIDFRMEIMGSGSQLATLTDQFSDNPHVQFLGHVSGEDYWETLKRWKYIIFFSDYEGLPISLIEGVAAGALPIYPDFHEGEDWITPLNCGTYYPQGDTREAVARLRHVESSWSGEDWTSYLTRARSRVEAHTPAAYQSALVAALEGMAHGSTSGSTNSSMLPGWLPLWVCHRLLRYWQMGSSCRKKGGA